MQVASKEGLEEAAKKLFVQDYEMLTQIQKERTQGKSEDFLQSLYRVFDSPSMPVIEGRLVPRTPSVVDILIDEQAYYQFVDSVIASLSQALDMLWELLESIPTALSAFFRDWSWVNAVISEPYRTEYGQYRGTTLKVIPARLPALDQNLITGQFEIGRASCRERV